MKQPFFSIIVVSYNAEAHIRETIESVLRQSFDDFEIVVKDACSKDGTLAQIPEDSRIRVYAEKDKGIYDGMNAAIGYAKGKYLQFLNCGDIFADEKVLKTVYEALQKKPSDMIYGHIRKFGKLDKQITKATRAALCRTTICHQAIFYAKEVFDAVGVYDLSYSLCADREHLVRACTRGFSCRFIPIVICEYLGNGASESTANVSVLREENEKIQSIYFTERERKRCSRGRRLRRFIRKILKGR